jgi:transposase
MHITSIGIDLGKTTFHLVTLGEQSKVLARKKFSRKQLLAYTANLPSSLIGMEACSGAHFIAAAIRSQGHDVRLIPAQFVKPYLKSNKNDFLDAEAIAEAVARQNMRFVPIKSDEQLDLQALHRVRDRLVQRRTAVINQIRGFLIERGITFPKRPANLRNNMVALLEDAEANLSPRMRRLLEGVWQEWKQLEADIDGADAEIERIASADANCQRLRKIPGVGPLASTAMVAAIGNGAAFRLFRLARFGPQAALHRRQGPAVWHQQAGQRISAPHVYPWRTRGAVSREVRHRWPRTMDAPTRSTSPTQQGHRRHCQQARTHRMGGAVQRRSLSTPTDRHGVKRAVEKTLRLESQHRFPLFHRLDGY